MTHGSRGRDEQAGFTVIEVLVAMFVLVVGALSLLGLFVSAGKGSDTSQRQDLAAELATSALEQMRTYPYAALHLNDRVTSLPDGRLLNDATQFQATSSIVDTVDQSPLVACASPTSYSTSCSPFAPKETITANGRTWTIYRVVSYDRQSCALGSLSSSAVSTLSTAMGLLYTNLLLTENDLNTLTGGTSGTGTGTIAAAVTSITNQLLGALGLLNGELTQLKSDLSNQLSPLLGTAGLSGQLSNLSSTLNSLAASGYLTTSGLTASIVTKLSNLDLCALTDAAGNLIPNLNGIQALGSALGTTGSAGSVNQALATAQSVASSATGLLTLTSAASLDANLTATGATGATGADVTISASLGANGSIGTTGVSGAVGVSTSVGYLKNLITCLVDPATPCQSVSHVKRISVAVVLNANRTGVGVTQPVWMSSAVADPSDGLR